MASYVLGAVVLTKKTKKQARLILQKEKKVVCATHCRSALVFAVQP